MTATIEHKIDTQSLLLFDNVGVKFDDLVALEGMSFELRAGETRVILGAAGSGKTTLLKIALGLIRPDSGSVYLFGQEINDLKEKQLFAIRSRVGVLFQEGGLFDSITVGANVAYPLLNRATDGISLEQAESKVVDALHFVELGHTLEKFP